MVTQAQCGWRCGKSVLQCNRYMLENEVETDCCFEVGLSEEDVRLMRAHTYMLVARSEVFEAMFCGGLAESCGERDRIKITDIHADVFKELLMFIYCETANISLTTALGLMYCAKKYLVHQLVEKCREFLLSNLNKENVCCILEQSILLDEPRLKEKSLRLIDNKSDEVLKSSDFLQLSLSSVKEIAQLEDSWTSEVAIYEACIDWARHQLTVNSTTAAATDNDIRTMLGSVLYHIRFQTMKMEEFAQLTANSEVLSEKEKTAVDDYFTTRQVTDELPFSVIDRRSRRERVVDRFSTSGRHRSSWHYNGNRDAINFTASKNIALTAVGLYGGYRPSTHAVTLEIWDGNNVLSTTSAQYTSDGTEAPVRVRLSNNLAITAGCTYTVVAKIIGNSTTHFGENGNGSVDTGCVTFTFSTTTRSNNGTKVHEGQIPQLFFLPF